SDALERGQMDTTSHYLDLAPADLRGWEWRQLSSRLDLARRVHHPAEASRPHVVYQLYVSRDGHSYIDVAYDPASKTWSIRRWNIESGQLLQTTPIDGGSTRGQLVALDTSSQHLLLQFGGESSNGKYFLEDWDLERGVRISSRPIPVWLAISPDGLTAAY